MEKKENRIKKCPICEDEGHIPVSVYIKKNGTRIPTHIAPCPRCRNPY